MLTISVLKNSAYMKMNVIPSVITERYFDINQKISV
jgi:hypothetical protein